MAELRWGILSAFPKLMPVFHDLDHYSHESSEGLGGNRSSNRLNCACIPGVPMVHLVPIRVSQHCNAVMIIQAFMAIEAGQSPQAWLSIFEHRMRGLCTALEVREVDLKKSKSDCMWVGV